MIEVTYKNATGIEFTTETENLSDRLRELEHYEIMRRRASEANPELMTTGKDITVANEIAAIKKMFADEKNRNFLTPVIERIIAEGAEDRIDALEVIAVKMERMGSWGFAKEYGTLDLSNTAEEFSIQFMSAYNKEIGPRY